MSGFFADNDEFRVELENRISFDTTLPSVQLFPESRFTLTRNVTFGNLVSTIMYFHRGAAGNPTSCESWSALLVQEHGPHVPNYSPVVAPGPPVLERITRNIPAEVLGTVPTGTNYIDVRVRLRRTTVPPVFLRQAPPYMFHPENEWINLPGGSCICEYFSPLARHFDVVLSGTNVMLNIYQSTREDGITTDSTDGNSNNGNFTQIGTAWGNYPNAPVYWAQFAVYYDSRGPDSTSNKRPPWGSTSTGSCTIGPVVNYTSQYSVDFEITPGRYRP